MSTYAIFHDNAMEALQDLKDQGISGFKMNTKNLVNRYEIVFDFYKSTGEIGIRGVEVKPIDKTTSIPTNDVLNEYKTKFLNDLDASFKALLYK